MSYPLKMRFMAEVTDLKDTLTRAPVFNTSTAYNKELLDLTSAFEQQGRPLPKFSEDFSIYQYAHRSVELCTYLCTILDTLLSFNHEKTDYRIVFEYEWDIRKRSYNMHTHLEVLRMTEDKLVYSDEGDTRRTSVSTRSGPRSIVVQPGPPPAPPPPAEPQKRRMTLRRAAGN